MWWSFNMAGHMACVVVECWFDSNPSHQKSREFKKTLDKLHKVWYNKDTKRTGTSGK